MNVADAVAELNPVDDIWQAVPSIEFGSFFLRRHGRVAHIGKEDSLLESSMLDQRYAEVLCHPLSHDKLVRLQCSAAASWLALGLD